MDNPEKSATVSTYDTGRHGRDRMVVGFTTTYIVCNMCLSPLI
jgi:hypothetical protein